MYIYVYICICIYIYRLATGLVHLTPADKRLWLNLEPHG